MQQKKKLGLRSLLIVAFVLSAFAVSYSQTTSGTIAPRSLENHAQQDSETLKSLEIANIRLAAANEKIKLLEDRLKAKDATIEAREAEIATRKDQLEAAKSASRDRATVITGDAVMLRACEQQLARSDAENVRLRNPGFFRSIFDSRSITGAAIGFGIGRITK